MSVEINAGSIGAPTLLFETTNMRSANLSSVANYDVSADGERFVMVVSDNSSTELHVVLNWFSELERLVPSNR